MQVQAIAGAKAQAQEIHTYPSGHGHGQQMAAVWGRICWSVCRSGTVHVMFQRLAKLPWRLGMQDFHQSGSDGKNGLDGLSMRCHRCRLTFEPRELLLVRFVTPVRAYSRGLVHKMVLIRTSWFKMQRQLFCECET